MVPFWSVGLGGGPGPFLLVGLLGSLLPFLLGVGGGGPGGPSLKDGGPGLKLLVGSVGVVVAVLRVVGACCVVQYVLVVGGGIV